MSQPILRRTNPQAGVGLQAVLAAQDPAHAPAAIPSPPENVSSCVPRPSLVTGGNKACVSAS